MGARSQVDTPVLVARGAAQVPVAAQIGRYRVLDALGQGGMSTVVRARDPHLRRELALKVIRSDFPELDQTRLVREAQALARLSHPHVVQVLDVGIDAGRVFVAMELIEGQTLRDWWEATEPTEAQLLEVFDQAGRGLAAAHRAGIVHRDFKPDNAMLDDQGTVRVMDFGLAIRSDDQPDPSGPVSSAQELTGSALTRPGATVGTPAYMPPEQLRGIKVDARADQFAFAVALWEGITGSRPFRARRRREMIGLITRGVRPPQEVMSAPVFRVLRRALQADPDQRWPDMEALLAALRRTQRPSQLRRAAPLAALTMAVTIAAGVLMSGPPIASAALVAPSQEHRDTASAVDGEAADHVRHRLAVERTRYATGGYAASLAAATELAKQADRLGHAPLCKEAYLLKGHSAAALSRWEQAEAAFTDAYFAAKAAGDPSAALIGSNLVRVLAPHPERHDDAKRWAGHVRALLEQHPSRRVEAHLEHSLGLVALHADGSGAAHPYFERELRLLLTAREGERETQQAQ